MNEYQSLFSDMSSRPKRKGNVINKAEKKKEKCGILVRVSTDMQVEDGDSIQMQKELAGDIVTKNEGVIHDWYIEEGISASKNRIAQRPELQRLLDDIESGIVTKLVAYKRDRLTRNTGDWLQILEICAKNQCDIIFSASGEAQLFNDPVYGKVFETILGSISEMESANTSMRVRDTMSSLAKSGEWTGGTLPYGYVKNEYDQIEIEEDKVAIVDEIVDLYLSGLGLYSIVKWLNGELVKTLGRREGGAVKKEAAHKARVAHWTKSSLESVLFNPFYAGIIEYSKEGHKAYQKDEDKFVRAKGKHPAMRTLEKQREIYKVREKKSLRPARSYNTTFLFSDLLYCGYCGEKYQPRNTTKNNNRYSYYCCSSRQNSSKTATGHHCLNKNYKKEILEDFLISELKKFFKKIKLDSMSKSLHKNFEKQKSVLKNSISANELNLKRLIQDESKIVRLILDINPKNPMYALLKEKYEIKYTHILAEIAEKKKVISELNSQLNEHVNRRDSKELKLTLIAEITHDFSKGIDVTSMQKKRILLTELINKITINVNGDCEIELYDLSDIGTNSKEKNK
jgi:DNA invertase Pin-like site-specific DNA recombinase